MGLKTGFLRLNYYWFTLNKNRAYIERGFCFKYLDLSSIEPLRQSNRMQLMASYSVRMLE